AHHQRYLLRLLDVIELGEKIEPPQCDAEQEPQSCHRTIAAADAQPPLGQVQLEPAQVVRGGGVGRALQECGEPLAGAYVALLCERVELARAHVLDHALAQRADSIGTHSELLSEVDNTSILRAHRPITDVLSITCRARRPGPAQ